MSDSEGLATERTRLIVARRMDTLDVSAYTDEEDRIPLTSPEPEDSDEEAPHLTGVPLDEEREGVEVEVGVRRRRSDDSNSSGEEGGAASGEPKRRSRRERRASEGEDTRCGLMYCLNRFLKLLPSIGDDSETPEAGEAALRYGAKQVVMLIVPVTICMIAVVVFELSVSVNSPASTSNNYFLYAPLSESDATSGGQTFLFALTNALIIVAIVVVMTIVLVCLFKFRCYRAIQVWLLVASGSLLFIFSSLYFIDILMAHNLPIDWFSFSLFVWNFGVVGLVVIHWKGPLRLQQAYLILISALVATRFLKYLPEWTTWMLLAAISIYDLIAVLCPKGPLRVLVETAKERNRPIFPALIYSSTMVWIVGMADVDESKKKPGTGGGGGSLPQARPQRRDSEDTQPSSDESADEESGLRQEAATMAHLEPSPDHRGSPERQRSQEENEEEEEEEEEPRGFKLGLGDFIFYSILVGKAAHDSEGDWVIISSCFVAILIGLCLTSIILGIVRRALPALPISIFFGLMFYFSSRFIIAPFVAVLNTTQVFI